MSSLFANALSQRGLQKVKEIMEADEELKRRKVPEISYVVETRQIEYKSGWTESELELH
jgi:hypothetical protein